MKVFKTYFQKSKVFLYPLLGIAKGARYIPEETYISWDNNYTVDDMKLFCVYKHKHTDPFQEFETKKLIKNKRFFDYKQLENNKHLYIFDFSNCPQTWLAVTAGLYSRIHEREKEIILSFFGEIGVVAETMESYIYPEEYHEDYAKELNVSLESIQNVYEVCDPPNLDKETLKKKSIKIKFIKKEDVSLP
jgi:hypothetical protein